MSLLEAQIPHIEKDQEPLELRVFSLQLQKPEFFDALLQSARSIYSERQSIRFTQLVLILYTTILMGCSPISPVPAPDTTEIPPAVSTPHELQQVKPELIKFSRIESATSVEQVSEMSIEEEKIITIPVPIEGAYFQQMEIRFHFEKYVSGIDALTGFDSMSKEDFAAKRIKLRVGLDADEDWRNMTNEEKLLAVKHELTHVLQLTAMQDQAAQVMLNQQLSNGWKESELVGTDSFYIFANTFYQLLNRGMSLRYEVVPYLQLNLDYQHFSSENKDKMSVGEQYVLLTWKGREFNQVYGAFLEQNPMVTVQNLIEQEELYQQFRDRIVSGN